MATMTSCMLNGQLIDIDYAIDMKDSGRASIHIFGVLNATSLFNLIVLADTEQHTLNILNAILIVHKVIL
jgi:hypothetical protein